MKLKKRIEEIEKNFKFEKLKMNKLNEEIFKTKNPKSNKNQEKTNINDTKKQKTTEDFEALKSSMRIQYRELEEQYQKLKEQIKLKEEKVF